MIDSKTMKDFLGDQSEIPQSVIDEITKLCLAYAFVEQKFWNRNAKFNESHQYAERLCNEKQINIDSYFNYFKGRYLLSEDAYSRLCALSNQNKTMANKIKKLIELQNPTKIEKANAIISIIIRLRNNLLHGNKMPYIYDEEQATLLNVANAFLSSYLNAD